MDNRSNWADRPLWVRIALFGVPSRKAALIWMNGALAFTILAFVAFMAMPITVDGVVMSLGAKMLLASVSVPIMLIAPLWYWLAIRWADERDGWAMHSWKS